MPSPAALFASLLFGLIGMVVFRHGKREVLIAPMLIGLALMLFPYLVTETWQIYAIGGLLCAAAYWLRD